MTAIEKWGDDRPLPGSPMGRQWEDLCHWQDSLLRRLSVIAAAASGGFSGMQLRPGMAMALETMAEEAKGLVASAWPGTATIQEVGARLQSLQFDALEMRAHMRMVVREWPQSTFVDLPGVLASLCEEANLTNPPNPSVARWHG